MIQLLISIILYCLSGALDAFMDTIKDHYSVSKFKNYNPYFWCPAVSWKNKYIDNNPSKGHRTFTVFGIKFNYPDALTDAWHIAKIFREGCNILAIVVAFTIQYRTTHIEVFIALIVLFGVFRNLCFNLFYNKILV